MSDLLSRLYPDLTDEERQVERSLNAENRSTGKYILNENNVAVSVPLGTWAVWIEREASKGAQSRRVVKQETVGPYWVSTVFIALDHSFFEGEPRELFETMIFLEEGRKSHGYREYYCERYATWEQARTGHERVVERVRLGDLPEKDYT